MTSATHGRRRGLFVSGEKVPMARSVSAARRVPVVAAVACAAWLLPELRGQAKDLPPAAAEFQVNAQTEKVQQSAAVAIDGAGSFVVVWQSEVEGSGDEIRARRFDARGLA